MKKFVIIVKVVLLLLVPHCMYGQVVSFSHLNTSNGLSENNVRCMTIDKNGFLWIGTTDGLNAYDGYTVTSYSRLQQPVILSDTITGLFCDQLNNIWVNTPSGIFYLDSKRKFHVVDQLPRATATLAVIFETAAAGLVLFSGEAHFRFDRPKGTWKKVDGMPALPGTSTIYKAKSLSQKLVAYLSDSNLLIVDHSSKKIVFSLPMAGITSVCLTGEEEIAIGSRTGIITLYNIYSQLSGPVYDLRNGLTGQAGNISIYDLSKASDGSLVVATGFSGLIVIDRSSGKQMQYKHEPFNPVSLSSNIIVKIITGNNGDVIAASNISGVNIFNTNIRPASYNRIFKDLTGNIYEGHLNEMAADQKNRLWMGASDRLICWDRSTNNAAFYYYSTRDTSRRLHDKEIRSLCIDRMGRVWVGSIDAGVGILNKQNGKIEPVTKDTSLHHTLQSGYINDIIETKDGKIWGASYSGLFTIDPADFRVTIFKNDPVLNTVAEKTIISLYEDLEEQLWIGTQRFGIFCYNKMNGTLINYTIADGLLSNTGYAITGDKNNTIYIAAITGFSMITAGKIIRTFSRTNGLLYNRCESITPDNDGNIWIANNKGLVKLTPASNKLEYFEENTGISKDGFRYAAVCKTNEGLLCWGTNQGINFFDPALIKNYTAQLRVTIYQALVSDSIIGFDNSSVLKVPYSDNSLQLFFAAINLTGSRNIAYQYKLEGYDKDWQKGNDIRQARYSSLPSGHYTFRVKASIDKVNWVESSNNVTIKIIPPFWRRWWFIALALVFVTAVIIGIFQFRLNRVRYAERLKAVYTKKIAETEMRALRAQMNPHFIFNSLNSINKYILKSDHANASRYLTRFAKLIRLILDNSNSKEVALSDELEALKLYIEMESLRFTNKFEYEIIVDDNVSADTIQVPPLIIQPYVENAIWHGLLHKETDGRLSIAVKTTPGHMLQCTIEDNGIGRARAKELKSKSAITNKSLGMKLTEERIIMLNQYNSLNATIEIIDMEDESGEATGTKVILTIPV